jgi:hypothetical protein
VKRWLAAATLFLIAALSIVGPGTTATSAATFTYGAPTNARVGAPLLPPAESSPAQLRAALEVSAPPAAEARGASTTSRLTFNATNTVDDLGHDAVLVRGGTNAPDRFSGGVV